MLTVFGYYTDDNLYTKHADILSESAKKFGIDVDLHKYTKNEWQKVIAIKASVIKKVRDSKKGGILYIDVDAIFLKDISEYFNSIQEDIAVHYLRNKELLSGTIFFNDTEKSRNLINEWVVRQEKNPEKWDQKILQEIIEEFQSKNMISVKILPPEYTFIFDTSKKLHSDAEPFIEHLQASRDSFWVNKYKKSNFLKRMIMLKSPFCKVSKKVKKRHSHVNKRCNEINIKNKITLLDLI